MKTKVFTVLALWIMPVILICFINTESTTVYKWWEKGLGIVAISLLYYGYYDWCFNIVFKPRN